MLESGEHNDKWQGDVWLQNSRAIHEKKTIWLCLLMKTQQCGALISLRQNQQQVSEQADKPFLFNHRTKIPFISCSLIK